MTKRTSKTDMPLIKRPIDEIVQFARAAGRTAFANADVVEGAAQDIRFEWVGRNFPSGMGMPEDQFNDVIVLACKAFDEGIDEYHNSLCQPPAKRLRGVSYFFSEESSYEYGVQIDVSRLDVRDHSGDALYERFYQRLLSEFDALRQRIAAAGEQVNRTAVSGSPISFSMLADDVFVFRIAPVALERDQFRQVLPTKLREFVDFVTGSEVSSHE